MSRRASRVIWMSLSDLLLCVVSVVIVAVAPPVPIQAGVETKAEYLIRASWPVKDYDADVDLWLRDPKRVRVSFNSRQDGCVALDMDNRGWSDSAIPGSDVISSTAIETISLRCIWAGHYDAAVNFFAYASHPNEIQTQAGKRGVPVHVWIEKLNPENKIVFQADLILNSESPRQSINFASFDITPDGELHFVDPPLTPVPAEK